MSVQAFAAPAGAKQGRTWARPTHTRAPATARGLAAELGVARLARDHSAKDALSVRSPPQRCAAQPPGI